MFNSRAQSPAIVGTGSMIRFQSPSPSIARSPASYFRTPPVGSYNVSLINESYSEWVEPLKPEVCFEHLWTEPAPAIRLESSSIDCFINFILITNICTINLFTNRIFSKAILLFLCNFHHLKPVANQRDVTTFDDNNTN